MNPSSPAPADRQTDTATAAPEAPGTKADYRAPQLVRLGLSVKDTAFVHLPAGGELNVS